MNDYYQKYIKYKTKYFEIKYGGSGKGKKEPYIKLPPKSESLQLAQQQSTQQQPPSIKPLSWASVVKPPSTPQQLQPQSKQQQLLPPLQPPPLQPPLPSTPPLSTKPPPVTPGRGLIPGLIPGLTPGSTVAGPSTPKLEIDQQTVESIIRSKDKLITLLRSCVSLSNYDITQRIAGNGDLYINFKKNSEHTFFAHFSFHNPTDPPSTLKLNDMFDINAFHLRYDSMIDIFFNLRKYDNERLILQSPMKEEDIIALIGCENYYELIKIKNCLEETLNRPEIRQNITDPVAKKLKF